MIFIALQCFTDLLLKVRFVIAQAKVVTLSFYDLMCGRGGTGRRAALRSLWELNPVEVQILSAAPFKL